MMRRESLREFWSSRVSKAGVAFLVFFIAVSIYVVATYPLDFGLRYWNNPGYWADYPRAVPPNWIIYFTDKSIPPHIEIDFTKPTGVTRRAYGKQIIYEYKLRYLYDDFPSFLSLTLRRVTYHSGRPPRIEFYLIRPDGSSVRLLRFRVQSPRPSESPPYHRYSESPHRISLSGEPEVIAALAEMIRDTYGVKISADEIARIGVERAAFGIPEPETKVFRVLKGDYSVRILVTAYNERDSIRSIRVVIGGKRYGFLGTDTLGRDLAVGLLFGFPVALLIGVTSSTVTTLIGATAGIISGYLGGKIDTGIQRLSDIILNIPILPILIFFTFILGTTTSRLWVIIAVLVAFSWPGLTIVVRPMVLQVKESQFIEAAVALGASKQWIMFKHIFPQVAPFIFAQLIFFTPSAILAEAALSFLGLGDPSIPTWGQILEYGFRSGGVYLGYWWWILPPGLLIVLSAITFVLIALGLEPVVNPRLRGMR